MDKEIEERIRNLGNVSVSPRVAGLMSTKEIDLLLARHVLGDFGEVNLEAVNRNDLAMFQKMGVVTSIYETERGNVYVITRFNQPVTIVAYDIEVEDGTTPMQELPEDTDSLL